jgi:hypothetical protein
MMDTFSAMMEQRDIRTSSTPMNKLCVWIPPMCVCLLCVLVPTLLHGCVCPFPFPFLWRVFGDDSWAIVFCVMVVTYWGQCGTLLRYGLGQFVKGRETIARTPIPTRAPGATPRSPILSD